MRRAEKVAVLAYGNGDREAYWTNGGELDSFRLIWQAKADPRGYGMLTIMPRAAYLKDPYAGEPMRFGTRAAAAKVGA